MTTPEDAASSSALMDFDIKYRQEIERERIERAKENVFTKKMLLGQLQETFKIVFEDGYVEVRSRISQKESDMFPDVAEILTGKIKKKDDLTKKQEKAMDKKVGKFLSYIIVSPKLLPEELDNHLTAPMQKTILTSFLISQGKGMSDEAVQFFRTKW